MGFLTFLSSLTLFVWPWKAPLGELGCSAFFTSVLICVHWMSVLMIEVVLHCIYDRMPKHSTKLDSRCVARYYLGPWAPFITYQNVCQQGGTLPLVMQWMCSYLCSKQKLHFTVLKVCLFWPTWLTKRTIIWSWLMKVNLKSGSQKCASISICKHSRVVLSSIFCLEIIGTKGAYCQHHTSASVGLCLRPWAQMNLFVSPAHECASVNKPLRLVLTIAYKHKHKLAYADAVKS